MSNIKSKVAYVMEEITPREVMQRVQGEDRYTRVKIVEHQVNHEPFTEEQQKIQDEFRWHANVYDDIRLTDYQLNENIERIMYNKILDGVKTNIKKDTLDEIMDTKFKVTTLITEYDDGEKHATIYVFYGNEDTGGCTFSTDLEEMDERLKDITSHTWRDDADVHIETLEAKAYTYNWEHKDKDVERAINKIIREKLTYCLKNDTVIVPEEYLAKGKEGIEEWRDFKSGKNKNNSIEKQLMKQVFRDKKERAYKSLAYTINAVCSVRQEWSKPFLCVDGRWNRGRMDKLATELLNTKDRATFMQMSDEEIDMKIKNYWKNMLKEALQYVEDVDIPAKIAKEL